MADFSASQTNVSPVENYVTPKEGVETPSPIKPLAKGVETALNIFGQVKKQKQNEGLMEHQRNILRIADAHAQNRITQAEAQSQMRSLLMDVADRVTDPELFAEYAKMQGDLLGLTGAAAVVKEGSLEEQQRQSQIDTAVQNGILNPNDTGNAEKVDYAVRLQQQFASEQYLFDQENARIDNILKRKDLTDAQREAAKQEQEETALRGLRGMGPAELQQASEQLNAIATNPDLTEAERVQALTEAQAAFEAAAKQKYGAAGIEVVNDFLSPFKDVTDLYLKKATGELSDAESQRQIDRSIRAYQELVTKDPNMVRAIALSEMVNLPGLVESGAIAKGVFNPFVAFLEGGQNGTPPNVAQVKDGPEAEAFTIYMNTLLDAAKSGDPDKAEEAYTHLENVLGSIEEYEGSFRKDAKAGILPAKLFASQKFLDVVRNNPDVLPSLNGAAQTMEDYYSNEVWLMVDKEFTDAQVRLPTPEGATSGEARRYAKRPEYESVGEAVSVEWTETGIRFRANDPSNQSARNKARDLNKKLKPVIETTIKAQAHLSGSSDYKGIWEAVSQDILGGAGGTDQLEGSQDNDELTMENFSENVAQAQPLGSGEVDTTYLGKIDGAGFRTGNMKQVQGMIIHHTAGRGTVDGVVNTLKQRGLSVQFVIDRDGRIHQLMPDNQVAYHAGKNNTSGFNNSNTIGVEIIGRDDSDILPVQVEAAQRLAKTMADKYGFDPASSIFGHGEVATHKQPTEGMTVVQALRSIPKYDTPEDALNDPDLGDGDLVVVNGQAMMVE